MRLRQGNISLNTGSRKFYWQCTDVIRNSCPTITYNLRDEKKSILRRANPDFDLEKSKRDSIWGARTLQMRRIADFVTILETKIKRWSVLFIF